MVRGVDQFRFRHVKFERPLYIHLGCPEHKNISHIITSGDVAVMKLKTSDTLMRM